jgi:hypothetical protein
MESARGSKQGKGNEMKTHGLLAVCGVFAVVAVAGCSKKEEEVKLAATATAVSAAAPPPSAMVVAYTVEKDGKTSVDIDAPNEHIKASTTASVGTLQVDLMNLANTRGEVKADLTTLTTNTFPEADKNATQTEHARNWLEVGTLVDDKMRATNQYAVFAIQSIDGLSATDLSTVPATKVDNEDVRTVTLTAHGDFLVHGRKAAKDVPLEVKFHYPAGGDAKGKPTKIDVATKSPLKVTLAEHDIKPRDNFGKVAQWTTNLVAKVGTVASVTIDVHAKP